MNFQLIKDILPQDRSSTAMPYTRRQQAKTGFRKRK